MQELEEAEQSIIRFSQSQSFDNELKSLDQASLDEPGHEQTPSQKRKNEVTKASSLSRLDPFVHGGLLRVGGRRIQTSRYSASEESSDNADHSSYARATRQL